MGKLLSGTAPLRGRAGLELMIPPLDHRLAAEFWGISDPLLAIRVNAVVGGTPAYRREFVRNDTPSGPEDFDAWVIRTVLNPAVLAAVADGKTTRGAIAPYVGRKDADIGHPINVL